MIHEYAVEPELVATWGNLQDFRFFVRSFGVGQPRVVSEFPVVANWRRLVMHAARELEGLALTRVAELVRALSEKMIPRPGHSYNNGREWLINAEVEHNRLAFYAILARANPRNHSVVLKPDDIGPANERWDVPRSKAPLRQAQDMCDCIQPMLANCTEVVFVDPYFRANQMAKRRPLERFLQVIASNRRANPIRIEVHVSASHEQAPETRFFKDECHRFLLPIIPPGLTVVVKRWRSRVGGAALHNRYVLTNIGGVSFGHGLDEGEPSETDDVQVLERQHYEKRWAEYAGPAPDFDVTEPPVTLQGRARR